MLKDTIISAFNYDGTLLKWLKKVEDALQGDTLTNIEVVTNSDYSMQLKLTFGDGTFILSPSFTNKGRGIVSITKTATSGLVDTYTVTYTDNTTSTFTVTNAEGFNANNLYSTLTAGTGIELTNNGQQVTVTAKRLLNEIVDSQGRQRFLENTITTSEIEGITPLYAKYSLSGTHLLIVQCLEIAGGTTIQGFTDIGIFSTPTFVAQKIQNVFGSIYVDIKEVNYFNNLAKEGELTIALRNYGENFFYIRYLGQTKTFANTVRLKITFDLLIDTD